MPIGENLNETQPMGENLNKIRQMGENLTKSRTMEENFAEIWPMEKNLTTHCNTITRRSNIFITEFEQMLCFIS